MSPTAPRPQGSAFAAGVAATGTPDATELARQIGVSGHPPATTESEKIAAYGSSMNGRRTDTARSAGLSQDREAAAAAADVMDSIATKLLSVRDFAQIALRDDLTDGDIQAEAIDVVNTITDAIDAARRQA